VTQRATPGFIKALRRATIAPEDEGLVIEQAPPRVQGAPPQARPPRVSSGVIRRGPQGRPKRKQR
jgi:hypothetical protein